MIRAVPTLLRIGFAQMVAYRTEFFIWVLTTTMPLIMLALMSAVAAEAPIQGYGTDDFIAYYLMILLVRQFTASWVVWSMTEHIKQGTMGLMLLRPVPVFLVYATENIGAIPLRGVIAVPLTLALLYFAGAQYVTHSPAMIALALLSIAGAWLITFFINCAIGCLAFFFDSATSVHGVYYGLFMVFSGYLLPLSLFPDWLQRGLDWIPFRYQLSVPVEIGLGRLAGADALTAVGIEFVWVAILGLLTFILWRAGLRRYAAFGG